jgi:hypothetical protein
MPNAMLGSTGVGVDCMATVVDCGGMAVVVRGKGTGVGCMGVSVVVRGKGMGVDCTGMAVVVRSKVSLPAAYTAPATVACEVGCTQSVPSFSAVFLGVLPYISLGGIRAQTPGCGCALVSSEPVAVL